jgi:hypothetical protein
MLRWTGGLTIMEKVQNRHIRGSMRVTPIEGKIKKTKMRWYAYSHERR